MNVWKPAPLLILARSQAAERAMDELLPISYPLHGHPAEAITGVPCSSDFGDQEEFEKDGKFREARGK
jgi:hypothetical protein